VACRRAFTWCAALVVTAAAVAVWRLRQGWAVVTVEGPSMEPTFRDGDRVAVRRTRRSPVTAGDVVVIEQPHPGPPRRNPPGRLLDGRRFVIKRVGAVAGEPVPPGIPVPDAVVPEGELVLLGDNAGASFDSRVVGYFSTELLLGGVARRMR
jgi:signal peptidase I